MTEGSDTYEVCTFIVVCDFPKQLANDRSSAKLEQILINCATYVLNSVLRYNIVKAYEKISVSNNPSDPGAVFTWKVSLVDASKVEKLTKQFWQEAVTEFS